MTSRKKIILSMVVIMVAVAATVGGTFAWFTAENEVTNTFTAGTVLFDLDETMTSDSEVELLHAPNVNPGDCYKKELVIKNTGTKYILLRMNFSEEWLFDKAHLIDNWESLGFEEPEKSALDDLIAVDGKLTWDQVEGVFTGLEDPVIWEDNGDKDGIETILAGKGWIYNTETKYWYYDGALSGAYPTGVDGGSIPDFYFDVCFDGDKMKNVFQASEYSMTIRVQAIQASNNASGDAWDVDSTYDPIGEETGENWDAWGAPINTIQ